MVYNATWRLLETEGQRQGREDNYLSVLTGRRPLRGGVCETGVNGGCGASDNVVRLPVWP